MYFGLQYYPQTEQRGPKRLAEILVIEFLQGVDREKFIKKSLIFFQTTDLKRGPIIFLWAPNKKKTKVRDHFISVGGVRRFLTDSSTSWRVGGLRNGKSNYLKGFRVIATGVRKKNSIFFYLAKITFLALLSSLGWIISLGLDKVSLAVV